MAIFKKIENNEFYLYMDGELIYKRWLDTGQSKVFDVMAYDKYTLTSVRELKYERHKDVIRLKAKLKLKTTEEGGRSRGFISGYRPQHIFEIHTDQPILTFIGDIVFDDQPTIEPGEEKIVTVRFLFEQPIDQYLHIGRKWWMREGGNIIAEAEIIEL
jgi:hypothetical protein